MLKVITAMTWTTFGSRTTTQVMMVTLDRDHRKGERRLGMPIVTMDAPVGSGTR
jgi:hypothetical protein